jgi:carboxyl-terminal processing protease
VRRKEREKQEAKAKLREARLAGDGAPKDEPVSGPGGKEQRGKVPDATKPTKLSKAAVALKNATRTDDGLQGDERSLSAELAAEKAAKNAKDVYLQEAAHILADESGLLKADTRLASRAMPYLSIVKQGAE